MKYIYDVLATTILYDGAGKYPTGALDRTYIALMAATRGLQLHSRTLVELMHIFLLFEREAS